MDLEVIQICISQLSLHNKPQKCTRWPTLCRLLGWFCWSLLGLAGLRIQTTSLLRLLTLLVKISKLLQACSSSCDSRGPREQIQPCQYLATSAGVTLTQVTLVQADHTTKSNFNELGTYVLLPHQSHFEKFMITGRIKNCNNIVPLPHATTLGEPLGMANIATPEYIK